MSRLIRLFALLLVVAPLASCSSQAAVEKRPAPQQVVARDAMPAARETAANVQALVRKFRNANRAPVSIVQLGDSHTAADLLSGQIRTLLQARYGDGGIGFIAATPVPGTRYDNVILRIAQRQWTLTSARNQQSERFPLGGYLSTPLQGRAKVHLEAREPSAQRYRVQALYQTSRTANLLMDDSRSAITRSLPPTNGQWRFSAPVANLGLPLDLTVGGSPDLGVGGWYLQGQNNAGVIYSTLGINGARLEMLDKWQAGWLDTLKALKPDLLVLAYGTNEAFDDTFDAGEYRAQFAQKLSILRSALPQTVLLVIGPPDSIKYRNASGCAARQPRPLKAIIQAQRQVAAQSQALFWDWQGFMGGDCAIQHWQAAGLGRPDLIHLTADGYRKTAEGLYQYLQQQLDLK